MENEHGETPGRAERRAGGQDGERAGRYARKRGVSKLDDALVAFLEVSGLSTTLLETRILRSWDRQLGQLSRRAKAVRFQGGVLTVEVLSAAHMHELSSFTGEGFRQAANRALGRERIHRIVYKLKQ